MFSGKEFGGRYLKVLTTFLKSDPLEPCLDIFKASCDSLENDVDH